jgi:hypothetical protein
MALGNQRTQNAGATSIFSFWIACDRRLWTASSNGSRKMRYGASAVTVQADNNQASDVALHRHEEKKGAKNKRFWRIMNKVYFRIKSGWHKQPETMDPIGVQHM